MSHDILAELAAYRAELAFTEQHGKTERADAVREQIDRVKAGIEARAVDLETRAESAHGDGQDVRAAELTVDARRYRDALAAGEPETAVESAPRERAVPRKKGA
jgi:hypothetical protein